MMFIPVRYRHIAFSLIEPLFIASVERLRLNHDEINFGKVSVAVAMCPLEISVPVKIDINS
jgi:hypothetical protein